MKKLGWLSIICLFMTLVLLLTNSVYAAPYLYSPSNNQIFLTSYLYPIDFMFADDDAINVDYYYAEVTTNLATDSYGYFPTHLYSTTIDNYSPAIHWYKSLPPGTYYWHVRSIYSPYSYKSSEWSDIGYFTIQNPPQSPLPKQKVKVRVTGNFHRIKCKKDKKYHVNQCKVKARHNKKCTKIILK